MTFILQKMQSQLSDTVRYFLPDFTNRPLNDWLGEKISIEHTGKFQCIQCNRSIKKTFQQGYCYPCLQRLYECNLCLIHPERCRVMEGCCPENDWAHKPCHAVHVIYLSYTSNLKVGITQQKNVPSRWVDQGAVAAAAFMTTSNRFLSGQVEMAMKSFVNDKTDWRQMLKESPQAPNLLIEWQRLLQQAASAIQKLIAEYGKDNIDFIGQPFMQNITYPVIQYPDKIISLSLDKTPRISGTLIGIKGQYLYLDLGVINIRKFGGYQVEILA